MNDSTLRLDKLTRQFGKRFVNDAIKSKTFLHALREIQTNGVKIRLVSGACRAYYDRRTRTIYLAKCCPRNYKIISVVHEYSHALRRQTIDPIPGVTGRQEFIRRCIGDEVEAIAMEVKCVAELVKAGVNIDEKELRWLKLYKRGGRRALYRELENTITSTTGETYPEYYGSWYDEIVPKHKRMP